MTVVAKTPITTNTINISTSVTPLLHRSPIFASL
jgi:hypothetical protein